MNYYKKYIKYKNKYLEYKKMFGGNINIHNFYTKFLNIDNSDLILIGRGGFGSVYLDPENPNSVYKITNDNCSDILIEKEKYDTLRTRNIDSNLCKILKMKSVLIDNDNNSCIIELTRAINPLDENATNTIIPFFAFGDH